MKLSIVVPCYNEGECIRPFLLAVQKLSLPGQVEFWFIDDGSTDATLQECKKYSSQNPDVHYVSFSRNFGKEAALLAGLRHATGDYIVTMDADLQDPPAILPQMLDEIKNGDYESVGTYRTTRKGEPAIRSWFADKFYWVMNHFSDVQLRNGARDYRLMTRKYVDAVLSLSETNRFTKGIYSWVGFKTKWLPFENVERTAGQTKWSFFKLLKYAIEGISAFSTTPLQLASVLGLLSFFISLAYIVFVIVKALVWGEVVRGYVTIICLITMFGGFQLFCIGILGLYLAKTYKEVKQRPVYIVNEEK